MIDFRFSVLPFIIIGIANFFLSWIYYSPLVPWFKTWQLGVGADINKTHMTEEDSKSMPRLMGGALVGFVLWIGFVITHSLNTQFEGGKPIVLVINNVLYLLSYTRIIHELKFHGYFCEKTHRI